jgi:hypothetical protein
MKFGGLVAAHGGTVGYRTLDTAGIQPCTFLQVDVMNNSIYCLGGLAAKIGRENQRFGRILRESGC